MIDRIWWEHIIKANLFIKQITDKLLGGKNIALFLPGALPWQDTMIEIIEEKLRLENPAYLLEVIECPKNEPGEFLLKQYCKKEKQASYRHGIGYSKFLADSDDIVLNNRYVWIRNIPEDKFVQWIEFAAEYSKCLGKNMGACFILETKSEHTTKGKKGIEKISYEETISTYDVYTFSSLLASEYVSDDALKPYLCDFIASICKNDVELCAKCMSRGEGFLNAPQKVIEEIVEIEYRSDWSNFESTVTEALINKKMWEAQIKFLFPIIENYRTSFVTHYKKILETILPIENSYGELITTPHDIEIGLLVSIVGRGELKLSPAEYEKLIAFKDARNTLAHINVLSVDEMKHILSLNNY